MHNVKYAFHRNIVSELCPWHGYRKLLSAAHDLVEFSFLQSGLILPRYIKIINLITSLLFELRKKKPHTHQWDSENIFTETEAASVSANIGFSCEGEQMGQGIITG